MQKETKAKEICEIFFFFFYYERMITHLPGDLKNTKQGYK